MNQKQAREEGIDRGQSIASWIDLPEIGIEIKPFTVPNFIGIIEDADDASEVFFDLACEAESQDRDVSPFEFTAKEINDCGDRAEGLWEAFDDGIVTGIRRDWNRRKGYYTT